MLISDPQPKRKATKKVEKTQNFLSRPKVFVKIDPRKTNLGAVEEAGKTPSRKPNVAGTIVHKFNRAFVKEIHEGLGRREDQVIDDERPEFLAMERQIAKE